MPCLIFENKRDLPLGQGNVKLLYKCLALMQALNKRKAQGRYMQVSLSSNHRNYFTQIESLVISASLFVEYMYVHYLFSQSNVTLSRVNHQKQ